MVGVPKHCDVVERAKSAEALTYLAHIEGAEECFNATDGKYAKR